MNSRDNLPNRLQFEEALIGCKQALAFDGLPSVLKTDFQVRARAPQAAVSLPSDKKLSECGDATVAILMCTYNGAAFLGEQLRSFERQSHSNWSLHVSDDGSHDGTLSLLEAYNASNPGKVCQVVAGPQRGFIANFLSLTCRADISADFYAWSDQDDIWKEEKLRKALAWLQTIPSDMPALYCGRTELVYESGLPFSFSPRFDRPPQFANALVQNIGGGNTMVFNQAARSLLQEAGADVNVPSHDWWAYQLVSGAGGTVRYDPEPMVLYRQHTENLVGTNSSWAARLKRVKMLLQGRFEEWNNQNINALNVMAHRLTEENQSILSSFDSARSQRFVSRFLLVKRAGVFRQTLYGNIGLIFAILIHKI